MPDSSGAVYGTLTAGSGQDFLRQISEYEWDDGGQSIGARLKWIGEDATSLDATAATHAGQAAEVVANFLADNRDGLSEIATGWSGIQRKSVGQINPALVQAYSSALVPFQGAMVGDLRGVRGFGNRLDSSDARSVVAVLDTDTDAGKAFRDAAYQRVRQYLRIYGEAAATGNSPQLVALRYSAELAGIVTGGQRLSGNAAIETRSGQSWINWAGYEVAVATGARPGDPDIPQRFFGPDGRLLPPDALSQDDIDAFSTAVENYAFQHGERELGNQFDRWFDAAAGT